MSLELQPESCRQPLVKKEIEWSEWHLSQTGLIEQIERVLYFDPTELYSRIGEHIDPFKRHQSLGVELCFPKQHLLCACGCGEKAKASDKFKDDGITPTWQQKWFKPQCGQFAGDVVSILNNYFGKPAKYIKYYSGKICNECTDASNIWDLQLDHIIGVKHGGGGCWLSNYRWLCHDCHVSKTNASFGRNGKTSSRKGQFKFDI